MDLLWVVTGYVPFFDPAHQSVRVLLFLGLFSPDSASSSFVFFDPAFLAAHRPLPQRGLASSV